MIIFRGGKQHVIFYSQTGCSFPRNITTFLSIKKYSLAISTLQVATESLKFLTRVPSKLQFYRNVSSRSFLS